ncbi:hypothetical protein FGIG_12182 [Fasciola gigantica]|uniref:Uncharacterized protein n=1 Tax=Fasciola gigantica TaxID=46835 RepID=A0A504YME9_FASGI|nr:hypothetical protein FGIG_12182 [Fasciola gigantica]
MKKLALASAGASTFLVETQETRIAVGWRRREVCPETGSGGANAVFSLQKEHQLLLKSSNKKNSCLDPSHSGSPTALIDPPRNDRSSSSNPAISSSVGPAQRPKPNPPMRRSSEISNTCSSASQTNMNFIGCSSPTYESNTSELAVHIESGGLSNIPSNPDSSSTSPNVPLCVNVSLQSISTSPVTRSLSRSSTPSPPPPPPPIQLHYPYPAMQSHVHHGQSHSLGINSPFVPNINRPTSGSVAHAVAAKSRPTLTSHGSHLANSPCQIPFAPPSPTHQTSRMSFTPSTRGSVTRRSTTVTAHPLQADTTTNASNYSTPFVSSQNKVSPVGQQQYPSRSTTQHILSPTGGHHFPAYPAVRQHITSGLPATSLTNLRGGRAPVPPASSALSSSGGSLGSGHVCINGK